jgi:hypothetical protein
VVEWLAEAPAALQASGLGAWARGPAYAWINVLHLLGLVLLVGGIGILDLRLCGLGRALPVPALARFLTPFALTGLVVAAVTGIGLFAADAVSLAGSNTFRWKLRLVLVGLANALLFGSPGESSSTAGTSVRAYPARRSRPPRSRSGSVSRPSGG